MLVNGGNSIIVSRDADDVDDAGDVDDVDMAEAAETTEAPEVARVAKVAEAAVTKTSKSTVTKMETVRESATSIASNGLSYKRYNHKFNANEKDSGFSVSFFKRRTADGAGTLNSLSWSTPKWPSSPSPEFLLKLPPAFMKMNGTKTEGERSPMGFDAMHAAVVAQGFFVARKGAGTYTFEVPAKLSDNWAYLWLGDNAYCDWTGENTALKVTRLASGLSPDGRHSIKLADGEAIPLTYIWANGGGVARSALRVRLPGGGEADVVGEGGGDIGPYFVQACDADVFAPKISA